MEQDFTKGLSVCIGNYGYYNEGYLHDTWITLPKTEAEIRDFLHLNHLQDPLHEEIYISDYDGIPFGATQLFTEFCQLEDLNLLAKQLVTVSPSDLEKVGAWIQASIALLCESDRLQDVPFIAFRDVGNGGEDGTVSRKIEHLLVRKPAMPDRSLAVDIRELQGAFLFRATRKDGVVATVFRSAESYEVNFSIKNCAVQSVADCAVLFIPFFKPGIFQIEIPGERHLIQAQQLIRFDSASIHHRTSPERQEVPFTLFAWLKLSPITVKSPISLFFFVRFYHLSSKKGHP